jgi:4-hydroxy-4-methyl-2-oxoglutarate aldolase
MNDQQRANAPIEQFRRLSTCVVASAIEGFHVRLPNTGFADSRVRCIFEDLGSVVGYAATARIRSTNPPMEGRGYEYARTDWWEHILSIPTPRIVVMEDLDDPPGLGAFLGEVHAHILRALGCASLVTNGAVRDLPEVHSIGFPLFAGNVSVSHAYAHIFDFGGPVKVGGLEVRPGDLLQGDIHGVQTIPLAIAEKIPAAAQEILRRRERVVSVCHPAGFSLTELRNSIKELEAT